MIFLHDGGAKKKKSVGLSRRPLSQPLRRDGIEALLGVVLEYEIEPPDWPFPTPAERPARRLGRVLINRVL